MKKLGTGLGAWGVGLALMLSVAHAQSGADAAPIVAGIGGVGAAGTGGMVPAFSDLRVVNAGAGIPVGGGVLIQSSTGTAPIVEITDSAMPSTTLGGTLTQIDFTGYWVWTPTTPLTVGSTYNVRLSSPDLGITGLTDSFVVVDAIVLTRPAVSTEPSVSSVSETNNFACCRSLQGGFLQDSSCFPSEQRRSVILDAGFSTSDPALLLNQFVFRMGPGPGTAASSMPLAWSSLTPMWFSTQAAEYCYELEALDIVSRTVYTYEDLESCVPHGDLGDLGVQTVEPGAAELDHLVCQAPPVQFTDQWCEINEDPCADDAMATACGLFGFVCRGEDLPPDPFATMGGFGGFPAGTGGIGGISGVGGTTGGVSGASGEGGSTAGEGGASGMSDDEDLDAPSEPEHSSGCSIIAADQRSSGSALGWSMVAAACVLATRSRRKRSRE